MSSTSLQIFITGVYRTGSTYLSLLLNNHPDLTVGLHTTNWFRERHETIEEALHYAEKRWDLKPQTSISSAADGRNDWDTTMRILFNSPCWGEKQQLETSNIPIFLEWFPNGKTISILRDPRSVMASWRRYTHHKPPAGFQAPFNSLGALQYTRNYSNELTPDRFTYVRYESLAQNPVSVLRKLIEWLGLSWPGREIMLSQEGWEDVPGSQWEDRSSYDDAEDVDVEAAVNRWRENLSKEEVAFVEKVCAEEMKWFGYDLESGFSLDRSQLKQMMKAKSEDPNQLRRILQMLMHWEQSGEGVEGFPDTDATKEETWTENQ